MNDSSGFSLLDFLERGSEGRKALANAMREVNAPWLSELVPVERLRDDWFLEPRLFCWTMSGMSDYASGAQLLYGALQREAAGPLGVVSDSAGVVYLGGVGRLHTQAETSRLMVNCHDGALTLARELETIPYHLSPTTFIGGSRIQWVEYPDPALAEFLKQHIRLPEGTAVKVQTPSAEIRLRAEQALGCIRDIAPRMHALLARSIHSVALLPHEAVSSFAGLGAHGMIFLNSARPLTLPSLVDGFVHQGGHVIFTEASLDRATIFLGDSDATVSANDSRTFYELLHGLFTEHCVLEAFSALQERRTFCEPDAWEATGRLALSARRLAASLASFGDRLEAIMTPLGRQIISVFRERSTQLARAEPPTCYDLTGHGEDFDSRAFFNRNPRGETLS